MKELNGIVGDWVKNPDYDSGGFTAELECGDRVLVAVPIHKDSGGGFSILLIFPTETGFDDCHGDSWSDWGWNDVQFYCVVKKPIV